MSCVLRAAVPLLLVLATLGAVHAGPPPTCAAGEGPGAALQDDANTGTDVGDALAFPLTMPGNVSWSGGLDIPGPGGPGDQADVYGVAVDDRAAMVNFELVSYALPEVYEALIVLDVFTPGAETPEATLEMGSERTGLPAVPGGWSFRVRYDAIPPGEACDPSEVPLGAPPEVTTLVKMYTLYVGCDPVCVDAAT